MWPNICSPATTKPSDQASVVFLFYFFFWWEICSYFFGFLGSLCFLAVKIFLMWFLFRLFNKDAVWTRVWNAPFFIHWLYLGILTFSAAILFDSLGIQAAKRRNDGASLPVTLLTVATVAGQRNCEKTPNCATARTKLAATLEDAPVVSLHWRPLHMYTIWITKGRAFSKQL